MTGLSKRIQAMQPSGTATVFDAVAHLRASGHAVTSLCVGEPDFATPPHILEAAKRALDGGATRYTEVAGLRSLREAICAESAHRRGVEHDVDQVVVSAGAKHALYGLSQVLFDPGDRVVIPTPCWGTYVEQARLCGADVVLLETTADSGFMPTPEALSEALVRETRAVVLCVPSNPTGVVLDRERWSALAEVLRGSRAYIVLDEIYGRLVYDGLADTSLLQVASDLVDRVIIVDGVSKTYAMTGFRLGWSLAPPAIARALRALQGQMTSNVAAVSQHAALAALTGDQACVAHMVAAYADRRDRLCQGLARVQGLSVPQTPQGAFYVFADARGWLGDGPERPRDDVSLAHLLLDEERLAVVPGSAFFGPGYLRLSYATTPEVLDAAVDCLERVARRLSR